MAAQTIKGTVKVSPSGTPSTDISTDVTGVTIRIERNAVEVPATMGADPYTLQGSLRKVATLNYLSSTSGASASPTSQKVWNAVLTGTTLAVSIQTNGAGTPSVTNPAYTFTATPLVAERGGTADELALSDVELVIVGDITITTS